MSFPRHKLRTQKSSRTGHVSPTALMQVIGGKGGGSTKHEKSSSNTTMHLYNPRPSNLPITQTYKVWSTRLKTKADFSKP